MKTLNKLSLAFIALSMFLASCAAFRVLDLNKISIGMDEETAYKSLQLKPDNVVLAKQYPAGTLKVVEYAINNVGSAPTTTNTAVRPQKYWLYFFNGKLAQYGKAGNLEEESEHIVAMQGK